MKITRSNSFAARKPSFVRNGFGKLEFSQFNTRFHQQTTINIMLPKDSPAKHVVKRFSAYIPAFTDIFDEESLYIVFFLITIASFVGAYFISKRVTIKDAGHVE